MKRKMAGFLAAVMLLTSCVAPAYASEAETLLADIESELYETETEEDVLTETLAEDEAATEAAALEEAPVEAETLSETAELLAEATEAQSEAEDLPAQTKEANNETEELPAQTEEVQSETEDLPAETGEAKTETEDLPAKTEEVQNETEDLSAQTEAETASESPAQAETEDASAALSETADFDDVPAVISLEPETDLMTIAEGNYDDEVQVIDSVECGDYTYTVSDGYATITGYSGSASSLTIPSTLDGYSVIAIGYFAFSDCSSLTSVVVPDGVTTINNFAFYNCTKLTIKIPKSVTKIGDYAIGFVEIVDDGSKGSEVATGVTIKGYSGSAAHIYALVNEISFVSIGIQTKTLASGSCGTNLTWKLDIYGTLTISGTGAMTSNDWRSYYYKGYPITKVVVKSGVTSICDYAFYILGDLTTVTIAKTVKTIGYQAFADCTSLTSVTFNGSLTTIGEGAFWGCSALTSLTLSTVKTISSHAFCNCTSLKKLTITGTVTNINDCAFKGCTALKTISITGKVKNINYQAFVDCSALTKLVLTSGTKSIDSQAFAGCSKLTSITIPKSVTSISTTAFAYYTSTTADKKMGSDYHDTTSKNPILTIKGYTGSTAETFALNNGITFVSINGSLKNVSLSITSLTNKTSGITLKWKKVSGASGYYIYRKTVNGTYKKIKTITSASTVSYTDTAVKSKYGTAYTYKVVAYKGSTKSKSVESTVLRSLGTSLTSVKLSSSGKLTVKWTKASGMTGYIVQYYPYCLSGNYPTTVTVKGTSKTSTTISSLNNNSYTNSDGYYYVRVRAYKTINGVNYYTDWSDFQLVTAS